MADFGGLEVFVTKRPNSRKQGSVVKFGLNYEWGLGSGTLKGDVLLTDRGGGVFLPAGLLTSYKEGKC